MDGHNRNVGQTCEKQIIRTQEGIGKEYPNDTVYFIPI